MHLRRYASAFLALTTTVIPPLNLAAADEITSSTHEYQIAGETYEGYVARPARIDRGAMAPAVLVVHDWMGNAEFSQAKADYLAGFGYIAFAVDMYGKGRRATSSDEAAKLAGGLYGEPKLFRERALAALEELKKMPQVDADRIGAIGFCFGGTAVLELARSGADVKGVVSFHGGLKSVMGETSNPIPAKIVILHGVRDPHVPPADLAACMADLNQANAWYQVVGYPEAVHAFTNPAAGDDPSTGSAYNATAEKGAIASMLAFFRGALAPAKPAR